MITELKTLWWRPGSMDMLMSLGTNIAYFALNSYPGHRCHAAV